MTDRSGLNRQARNPVRLPDGSDAPVKSGRAPATTSQTTAGRLGRPAMLDKRTEELIREISRMAERVGARFVPDPKKIAAFTAAHSNGHRGGEE